MAKLHRARVALAKARAVGVRQAARAAWRKLFQQSRPPQVDESLVAFECLSALVPRGTMVDVGAHFGGSLAPFLQAGWRVVAFEPDRRNRAALLAAFGDRAELSVDPRAVSAGTESGVVLFRSPLSTGISGLRRFHPSHHAADLVDTVSLAQALVEHRVERVDFLKIDTEGFDLIVLRGLDWNRSAPRLILCEFEDEKTIPLGYTYHDMARYLADLGHQIIVSEWNPVATYGERHEWRGVCRYPHELHHPAAWGNLLATRDPDLARHLEARLARVASTRATALS